MFVTFVSCIPGTEGREKELIEAIEKYLGVAFHIAKLIPAIIAIAAFRQVSAPIMTAAESDCADGGDGATEDTFKDLHEQVVITNDSLISQVSGIGVLDMSCAHGTCEQGVSLLLAHAAGHSHTRPCMVPFQVSGDCFAIAVAIAMAIYAHMKKGRGSAASEEGDREAEMSTRHFQQFKDEA